MRRSSPRSLKVKVRRSRLRYPSVIALLCHSLAVDTIVLCVRGRFGCRARYFFSLAVYSAVQCCFHPRSSWVACARARVLAVLLYTPSLCGFGICSPPVPLSFAYACVSLACALSFTCSLYSAVQFSFACTVVMSGVRACALSCTIPRRRLMFSSPSPSANHYCVAIRLRICGIYGLRARARVRAIFYFTPSPSYALQSYPPSIRFYFRCSRFTSVYPCGFPRHCCIYSPFPSFVIIHDRVRVVPVYSPFPFLVTVPNPRAS